MREENTDYYYYYYYYYLLYYYEAPLLFYYDQTLYREQPFSALDPHHIQSKLPYTFTNIRLHFFFLLLVVVSSFLKKIKMIIIAFYTEFCPSDKVVN